eukprot:jgi/Orpsp1_1/1181845/evm.model.c7180000078847.1
MFLSKDDIIYSILIIFSIFFTGILADDCEIYKKIVGSSFPYKSDLEEVNGQCCRIHSVGCDEQNNINH